MAAREYLQEVKALDATLVSIEKVLNLPKLHSDAESLEAEASAPNLWDDPEKAQVVTSKLSRCLLYTSPSPRDRQKSRMPSSA